MLPGNTLPRGTSGRQGSRHEAGRHAAKGKNGARRVAGFSNARGSAFGWAAPPGSRYQQDILERSRIRVYRDSLFCHDPFDPQPIPLWHAARPIVHSPIKAASLRVDTKPHPGIPAYRRTPRYADFVILDLIPFQRQPRKLRNSFRRQEGLLGDPHQNNHGGNRTPKEEQDDGK